jgi:hypothetical protein
LHDDRRIRIPEAQKHVAPDPDPQHWEKGSLTFVIRLLETSIVSAKFRSSNIYQKDGKLSELCHADMNI